jgi:DNA-binding response OmpR family regulator
MSKILLIEDDENLGFVIQDQLTELGHVVFRCRSAREGLLTLGREVVDICLLDVMMPVKSGFDLAEDIKKLFPNIPFIFLTAKQQLTDRLKGLAIGADDYITKPFVIQELNLRIQNILRRSGVTVEKPIQELYTIGNYSFDNINNYLIWPSGMRQHLTKKEASLLKAFCEGKGNVMTRENLANLVWGEESYFVARTMDVYIAKLRKLFSEDSRIQIINLHGVGFQFVVEE